MFFREVLNEDLGCGSYVVAEGGEAAVIDPKWEIQEYLQIAVENGFKISHIIETHNHADHLSGRGCLVEATGATIHVSEDAGVEYEHEPLSDDDVVEVGGVRIIAVATPGHRPEHLSFLVEDTSRGEEPWLLLTGDSLFVGDLARPDLAVEGPVPEVPVLAVAFTPVQGEYGERSQAERVRGAIEEWLADRALPWFELDMDLYEKPHARRPAQVEALVRRADVVVSMRLHALVLGLKHGRPVVACDPIAGGAKVTSQAAALDWPLVLPAEELTAEVLDTALDRCLSGELAERVCAAGERGRAGNARARAWFTEQLAGGAA